MLGPDDVSLTLDRAEYVATALAGSGGARYGFAMVVAVENRTERPLYMGRCFPTSPTPFYNLVQLSPPDRYGSAYTPIWACVGHDSPLVIPARSTRVDTLQIVGPNRFPSGSSVGYGQLTGEVEFGVGVTSCGGAGCGEGQLRELKRQFTIRLP